MKRSCATLILTCSLCILFPTTCFAKDKRKDNIRSAVRETLEQFVSLHRSMDSTLKESIDITLAELTNTGDQSARASSMQAALNQKKADLLVASHEVTSSLSRLSEVNTSVGTQEGIVEGGIMLPSLIEAFRDSSAITAQYIGTQRISSMTRTVPRLALALLNESVTGIEDSLQKLRAAEAHLLSLLDHIREKGYLTTAPEKLSNSVDDSTRSLYLAVATLGYNSSRSYRAAALTGVIARYVREGASQSDYIEALDQANEENYPNGFLSLMRQHYPQAAISREYTYIPKAVGEFALKQSEVLQTIANSIDDVATELVLSSANATFVSNPLAILPVIIDLQRKMNGIESLLLMHKAEIDKQRASIQALSNDLGGVAQTSYQRNVNRCYSVLASLAAQKQSAERTLEAYSDAITSADSSYSQKREIFYNRLSSLQALESSLGVVGSEEDLNNLIAELRNAENFTSAKQCIKKSLSQYVSSRTRKVSKKVLQEVLTCGLSGSGKKCIQSIDKKYRRDARVQKSVQKNFPPLIDELRGYQSGIILEDCQLSIYGVLLGDFGEIPEEEFDSEE